MCGQDLRLGLLFTYRCASIRCGYVGLVACACSRETAIYQCMRDRIQTVGHLVRKDPISASRMEKPTAAVIAVETAKPGTASRGFEDNDSLNSALRPCYQTPRWPTLCTASVRGIGKRFA